MDGEPGLGRTDAVIYAASGIAQQGGRVPQLVCWSAAIATNLVCVILAETLFGVAGSSRRGFEDLPHRRASHMT